MCTKVDKPQRAGGAENKKSGSCLNSICLFYKSVEKELKGYIGENVTETVEFHDGPNVMSIAVANGQRQNIACHNMNKKIPPYQVGISTNGNGKFCDSLYCWYTLP